jgi:hypothetical protein
VSVACRLVERRSYEGSSRLGAGPRAVRRWGSTALPSLREGALRCSVLWPVAELTSLALLAMFKQAATSQFTKRAARAATRPPLLGCAQSPPRRTALGPGYFGVVRSDANSIARKAPGGAWVARMGAAEKRRGPGRARSALRALTRCRCLSAESEANAASSATGPGSRASQGTRSAAKGKPSEPHPGPTRRLASADAGTRSDHALAAETAARSASR